MSGSSVALDTNRAIAVLNGEEGIAQWLGRFPEVCLPCLLSANDGTARSTLNAPRETSLAWKSLSSDVAF